MMTLMVIIMFFPRFVFVSMSTSTAATMFTAMAPVAKQVHSHEEDNNQNPEPVALKPIHNLSPPLDQLMF
jgi:membrane glycosyltransferase